MMEKDLDVILIGEIHTDLEQAYNIAKALEVCKPEYVLYEGFDRKNIPLFLTNKEVVGLSLRELCERFRITPKDTGFTEEILTKDKLERILVDVIHHTNPKDMQEKLYLHYTKVDLEYLPNTYEEIIDKPLAAYHPAVLEYFLMITENKIEELKHNGSEYNHDKVLNVLENKITKVIILAKSVSERFRWSLKDLKSRTYIILSAVYKIGAKIGSCDLDLEEKYKKWKEYIEGKISREYYHNLRERAMADSIEKYVERRQTDSPIIAIIGRGHLNNVAKLLDDKGIRYAAIRLKYTIDDESLKKGIDYIYSTNLQEYYQKLSRLYELDLQNHSKGGLYGFLHSKD